MMKSKRIQIITSHMPMFQHISPEILEHIADSSELKTLGKDEALFFQGDVCTGFYQVVSGSIKLMFTSLDGREHIAKISVPGDHFGEAVMFINQPYPLNAFAIEDSELLYLPKQVIDLCMEKHPDFSRIIIANLSEQLHQFANQISALTLQNATQRVIGYLLHSMALQPGRKSVSFTLPASKQVIASHLNMSPETLSRTFRQLSDANFIHIEGKKVHIPNFDVFTQLSG